MRALLLRFSVFLPLAVMWGSCSTLMRTRRVKKEEVKPILPPNILTELEVNRIQFLYENLPDFVAYGTYTMRFMFNRSEGAFKMYKFSDSIYVRLDDNRTFIISWDSLMNTNVEGGNIDLKRDTVVLHWDGSEAIIVDDRLIAYRGRGVSLRMEDYTYEPVPHPRRLVVRAMGASVILIVDSIKPLP